MLYSEAFKKLGYNLVNKGQDWSAANEKGVCLSLWNMEIKYNNGVCSLDTKLDCGPIKDWGHKPGSVLRKNHLRVARDKFEGRIDVVLRSGDPSKKNKNDSEPWIPLKRKSIWRIKEFDEITGHFRAETEILNTDKD